MTTFADTRQPESRLPALEEIEEIERRPAVPLLEVPVGVILATGSSSRLGGLPKPLERVAGITLLERAVATFRSSGLKRIIVVVGHEGARVREFVAQQQLDVEVVEKRDFELGNGSSVLVRGRAAAGRFLLAMIDHVFMPEAVTRLLASHAPFALAVDSQPRYCDVEEATKVSLEHGRVVAVSRELDEHDAVDAGLAVCELAVAASAERSLVAGGTTWNAVKRRWLAEGGEIEAVDLEGFFWIDVDTPGDVRRATRLIAASAARKASDGPSPGSSTAAFPGGFRSSSCARASHLMPPPSSPSSSGSSPQAPWQPATSGPRRSLPEVSSRRSPRSWTASTARSPARRCAPRPEARSSIPSSTAPRTRLS